MAFITNALNGAAGVEKVNPTDPTNGTQLQTAYDQSQGGIAQQQAFLNALAAQNGVGNQSSVFNQLQGVANGQGPNPAQAQLAQATGANTANQAALMAGQRGAGANAGLIARQAAMQGGANQQNSIGQAATLQANQSLGALNQLGGIAGQQVAQQSGALQNYNSAVQGQQANLLGAQANYNSALNGATQNFNAANMGPTAIKGIAGATGIGAQQPPSTPGTAPGGVPPAAAAAMAEGGEVHGPQSFAARHILGHPPLPQYAHGGKVDALVSPGERYLPPKAVKKVAEGKESPMKAGEKIPGKPKVGGAKNSYANDTVSKKLDDGGIVLPRSVTQSKDPALEAHKFVAAILAKQGMKK